MAYNGTNSHGGSYKHHCATRLREAKLALTLAVGDFYYSLKLRFPMKFISVTSIFLLLLLSASCSQEAKKRRYMTRGNQLFQQGKYPEAALAYRQALRLDGGNGEAD